MSRTIHTNTTDIDYIKEGTVEVQRKIDIDTEVSNNV